MRTLEVHAFQIHCIGVFDGKPYKTNGNEDVLRGRQVCSFVYLKGKPYETNGNEGFSMRTNSNTLALVHLNRKPYKTNDNEDILRGRQGQSRKSASAGSFTHRMGAGNTASQVATGGGHT